MRFFRARPVLVNMAMNKTKKVLMKTSHCDTPNGRLSYAKVSVKVYVVEYIDCHIQAVGEHIEVDIVGRCGPLSDADIPGEDQYKFYFAFENSNCDDYITEKFFNPIRRGDMVPVVMGASKEAYNLYGPQVRTYLVYCVHLSLLAGLLHPC